MQQGPIISYHATDPNDRPVILAEHVSKWYGQVLGLNDVSIQVGKGITGLLGPNGAGKSTFLKIVTGQIRAQLGATYVNGMNVWNNPELMSIIGYCPEQEGFYGELTGLEFVQMLLQLNGYGRVAAGKRAMEKMMALGMKENMNRKIKGYSRGMRQRTKIAQALAHDPHIIILDEPLAGLDPLGRIQVIEHLLELEKLGKTILVSSHILHEIERLTDRVILIHRGRVLAQGYVEEIRGLIDQHPHTIWIETPEPRRFIRILMKEQFVISARVHSDPLGFFVETHEPDLFYQRVPQIAIHEGLPLNYMSSHDDDLDSVFRYLVEGR